MGISKDQSFVRESGPSEARLGMEAARVREIDDYESGTSDEYNGDNCNHSVWALVFQVSTLIQE